MNNVFYFQIFSKFPGLRHGISTRTLGSMKNKGRMNDTNIQKFLHVLDISPDRLVLMEQIYSGDVAVVENIDEKKIQSVDSLVTDKENLYVGVVTADCLPILFYDPEKQIAAAVHGGYKGLSKLIINHTIEKLKQLGSKPKDVLVGIGPGIGVCCYNVDADRIRLFQDTFPSHKNFFFKKNDAYFLDLKKIALLNLLDEGISEANIEILDICTKDNLNTFYSYRGEGAEMYGEFISLIGKI